MTVLIIEDETTAGERLVKLVKNIRPELNVPDPLDSVEDALHWLDENPEPDVMLMDIELADGKSFEILTHHPVNSKIIFCTAFDQYALEAFGHHGVAYLLKPIKREELKNALERALTDQSQSTNIDYDRLAEAMQRREQHFQKRLLVKLGHRYKAISTDEIAYAFTEAKNVMVMTSGGKDIPVDQSLEQLEQILDPQKFFRINRKIIVNIDAIDNMYTWSRSRVKLELRPEKDLEAVVATDRAGNFKQWLEGRN